MKMESPIREDMHSPTSPTEDEVSPPSSPTEGISPSSPANDENCPSSPTPDDIYASLPPNEVFSSELSSNSEVSPASSQNVNISPELPSDAPASPSNAKISAASPPNLDVSSDYLADVAISHDSPSNAVISPDSPPNSRISLESSSNAMTSPDSPPNSGTSQKSPSNAMLSPDSPPNSGTSQKSPSNAMLSPDSPPNSGISQKSPSNAMISPDSPPNSGISHESPSNAMISPDSPPNSGISQSQGSPSNAMISPDSPPNSRISQGSPSNAMISPDSPPNSVLSPESPSNFGTSPVSPHNSVSQIGSESPNWTQSQEISTESELDGHSQTPMEEEMSPDKDDDIPKPKKEKHGSSLSVSKSKIDKGSSKKAKQEKESKNMEVDEIDPEDLEEGEIEDDEEEGMEVEEVPVEEPKKVSSFSKIFGDEKDKENHKKDRKEERKSSRKDKESSHAHNNHKDKESSGKSRDKDKEREKEKEKEKDRKKKRRHSESVNEVGDEDDKPSKTSSRDKRSRKSVENPEDAIIPGSSGGPEEDDDSYLFVRGGSPPSNLTPKQLALQNFAYAPNPDGDNFGRMYDDDSDDDIRRGSGPGGGRRHRSPVNRRRRQENREENGRGGRRGTGAGVGGGRNNKEEPKNSNKSDIICAYYMQGKCQKSHEECSFSHNAVPPRKMELCKFWMMDCCAKREKCLYLHNDFPCKFYHTGLVCKQADRCKFSHKPLNEVTKAVLLKHIETAPKEILGDFPRLNRNGALNLINKMESKILGALAEQERQKEKEQEPPRRTRWEQPTRDDQEKLQELMEEAGIGGFYRETLEYQPPVPAPVVPAVPQIQQPPPQHHSNLPSLMAGIQFMPPPTAPLIPQPTPPLIHNAALASVLANLNIPSTTIQPIVVPNATEESTNVSNSLAQPADLAVAPAQAEETENPYWNSKTGNAPVKEASNVLSNPPEHLPPMQQVIFRRLQEQQLKSENRATKAESDDDDRPDDDDWYSEDEEREERGNTSGYKDTAIKNQSRNQKQPGISISSVISSIRQTVESPAQNKMRNPSSPPGRGDIDLRTSALPTNNTSQSHGPFGDTDFRLSTIRSDLQDIDLRMTTSPGPSASAASDNSRLSNSGPLAFLKLPSGPATEIDASINSHPPVQYKLKIVLGVDKPDYRYIRHTLTPSQILMDPRLGPRPGSGTLSLIPDPASPPQLVQSSQLHSPATIPAGDSVVMDPRVRRAAAQQQQQGLGQVVPQQMQQQQLSQQMNIPQSAMPGLLGDPRFPRDPRTIQIGPPGGWPNPDEMAQAALAAQFMNSHQQMGIPPLFPFPNSAAAFPNPFIQADFSQMGQMGGGQGHQGHMNQGSRPQFGGGNQGQGRGRPVSSWERYSQQQSDQDGGGRGMSPSLQ